MQDLLPFLKSLCDTPGLSGYEEPIRLRIEEAWRPLVDELSRSRLGSLHGLIRGSAPAPRPSLLLTAHMDSIGLMVSGLVEGFLRLTSIGGIDPRILPGQLVAVHGRQVLSGLVVQPPAHLLPPDLQDSSVPLEYLLVDLGLQPGQVKHLVRPGDLVSFAQPPVELGDEILVAPSLDNRASVAALTACLQELKTRRLSWDVWAVATVQEEETLGGAKTSTFELNPSLAVVVDVTFADSPGSPTHKTYPMGKGLTLGWGPNIHPFLYKTFKELAGRLEIPYETEIMPRHSGTDADSLQIVRQGIPSMVVSIPLKYMHTPVEMVSLKDVARVGRLLAGFAAGLTPAFVDQIIWEDREGALP